MLGHNCGDQHILPYSTKTASFLSKVSAVGILDDFLSLEANAVPVPGCPHLPCIGRTALVRAVHGSRMSTYTLWLQLHDAHSVIAKNFQH